MTDQLTDADLGRIEYLLKKEMATRMGAIQEDRITGPTDRNVGNAKKYVEQARTLRTILMERGRQEYVPLRKMHQGDEWVNDEVADSAGLEATDDLSAVLEKLHDIAHPHLDAGSLTDHDTVPGKV